MNKKIKKLENRNNEFVKYLSEMLDKPFSNMSVSFKIEYFVGVDEDDNKNKKLVFIISNSAVGNIYEKYRDLKPFEIVADVEGDFMEDINTDLILAGIVMVKVEKERAREPINLSGNKVHHTIYMN